MFHTTFDKSLSYKTCLGIEKPDRHYWSLNTAQIINYAQQNYGVSLSNDQAQSIMNNSGGGNESEIDQAMQQLPQVQTQSMIKNAQALQNFQVQANQPAISTLQSQYNPSTGQGALVDAYNSLLSSIKGVGSVSENQATLGASNALAARGILPSSALFQQSVGSALLPVTSTIQNQLSQTGLGEQQDLGQLATTIAQLQAGNPVASITGAQNLMSLSNQAALIPSEIAANQGQAAASNAAANYIPISGLGVYSVNGNGANGALLGGYSQTGLSPSGNSISGIY